MNEWSPPQTSYCLTESSSAWGLWIKTQGPSVTLKASPWWQAGKKSIRGKWRESLVTTLHEWGMASSSPRPVPSPGLVLHRLRLRSASPHRRGQGRALGVYHHRMLAFFSLWGWRHLLGSCVCVRCLLLSFPLFISEKRNDHKAVICRLEVIKSFSQEGLSPVTFVSILSLLSTDTPPAQLDLEWLLDSFIWENIMSLNRSFRCVLCLCLKKLIWEC